MTSTTGTTGEETGIMTVTSATTDPPTSGGSNSGSGTSGLPTSGDPTTGGPGEPTLEDKCETCGFPEYIQACYCINDAANVVAKYLGCVDDAGFQSASHDACETELNEGELEVNNFTCISQIMCPVVNDLDATCAWCDNAAEVDKYYCEDPLGVDIFEEWGCADQPAVEAMYKDWCASALGKQPQQLTNAEFYTNSFECLGGGTTGDTTTTGTTGESTGGDSTTGNPLVGCDDWDPADSITYVSGVRYIRGSFVLGLFADPTPLIECDDVRLIPLAYSGYQFHYADPGELFYELGLRDGDIPQYLNGLSLIDAYDVLNAIGELWYAEGETEYELLVLRSGVLTALDFSVDLTQ